eukprot:TRINITY_DN3091_c1_g1_i4.p1 TRINITY_DN3091_c1_g1~~TRINITY_DN3091_c1_g1_i4.p1  ORF type:complete len:422 (+),score=139.53 TRINITY_DN3091_c1_g1_i4:390-1655(+)
MVAWRLPSPGKGEKMTLRVSESRLQTLCSAAQAAEDGSLEAALSKKGGDDDIESLRKRAADTLLRAAEDGSLEAALSTKGGVDDIESLRKQAADTLLRAAEDGSLESALSQRPPRPPLTTDEDEDLPMKAAPPQPVKAAPPPNSDLPVSSADASQGEEVEVLRSLARQTFAAASSDGRLAAAIAKTSITKLVAAEEPMEDPQELDMEVIKARACDALQKALGIEDEEEPEEPADLVAIKAKAADALQKALLMEEDQENLPMKSAPPPPAAPPAPPTAEEPEEMNAMKAAQKEFMGGIQVLTQQVKQELGALQGEVSGQLKDLKQLSEEVRKDVEDLKTQVTMVKSGLNLSYGSDKDFTMPHPASPKPAAASLSQSGLDLSGGNLADLERKLKERNEKFKRENDALRQENLKMKSLKGPRAD